MFRRLAIILSVLAALLAVMTSTTWAATPAVNLQQLSKHVDAALNELQNGDTAGAQAEFNAFKSGWRGIEDGVRAQDRTLYRSIEGRMADVEAAFAARPADISGIRTALGAQAAINEQFVQSHGSGAASSAGTSGSLASAAASPADAHLNPVPGGEGTSGIATSMAAEIQHLDQAQTRIGNRDSAGAAAEMKAFIAGWGNVEGQVAAKAPDTYSATENKMSQAYGLLTSDPPNFVQASTLVQEMKTGLAPFNEAPVRYTIFDAAIILLREGLEALLVLAALLAFLKKSGNSAKQRWIWAGGASGLVLSVVIAVAVNLAFAAAGGSSRELLEGVTGLLAAVMLIWMMFWLHSKANIAAWTRYVSESAGKALATNSLVSLAFIAFLAVLREGAETVLFYVGIAPDISRGDLFVGLAAGAAALAVVAALVLVVGVRIPIRPFFLATSVLIFFLALKFVGFGIHSLQVSGHLVSHTAPFPAVGLVGLFPSWEPTVLQLALLAGVGLALALTRRREGMEHEATVAVATQL